MKVLFIPWGLPPHYNPQAPMAWAFRAAGHEVRVAAQPAAVDAARSSGMPVFPVGESYDHVRVMEERTPEALRIVEGAKDATPQERGRIAERVVKLMGEAHIRSAEAMAGDLYDFARGWRPDLVLADPLVLAAPLVATAIGTPFAYHLWGDVITPEFGFPGAAMGTGPWADDLHRLYERFGVRPGSPRALCAVDPCPDALQLPGVPDRVPVRYVPYNGSGIVPGWLTDPPERPRVCVIRSGTTSRIAGTISSLVPQIIDGLSGLDVEIVVAVKKADRDLLGERPAGVRVVEELPLNLLLPSCAAIVHHGGGGTVLTAASLGVPQLTIPEIPAQAVNGARLASLGVGVSLTDDAAQPDAIKVAAAKLLTDEGVGVAARRLRDDIAAQDAPAEVVKTLEKMV